MFSAGFGKAVRIFLLSSITLLLPALTVCAEGVTILRHNGYSDLLIDTEYYGSSPSSFIRLELAGAGRILIYGEDGSCELSFSTGDSPAPIYLYRSLTGVSPGKIRILDTEPGFDLVSAGVEMPQTAESPLPADIGQIIFSDFDESDGNWRVYSWNLDPGVLIFDTASYEVQARLFKRLAFFVEKPGFVGTLVTNEGLEGRHGWNAHDYRADDLAAFFTKAAETGFKLNSEEITLRSLLVNRGIITESGEGYNAGRGAVLSVSRESLPDWRYRFLTHECLHGLFFTVDSFRNDMFEAFGELKPAEVEFWKHLLDYRGYDAENRYLLVNEYMAYALQQPVEEIDEYFKGFLYVRMIAARPYEKSFVSNFEENYPDSFYKSVIFLQKILYYHTGRYAGHLANIFPAAVNGSFFDLFPPLQ